MRSRSRRPIQYAIDSLEPRLQLSGPEVIGSTGQVSTRPGSQYSHGSIGYYVQSNASGNGSELLRTDGTSAGTYVIRTGMPLGVGLLKGAGDYLYFVGARLDNYTTLFRMNFQTEAVSQLGTWLSTSQGIYDLVEWNDQPYALAIGVSGAGVYSVDGAGMFYRHTALNFIRPSGAAPQLVATDGPLIAVFEDRTNPNWTQIWSVAETGGATQAATIQHRMTNEADVVGRVGGRAVMVLGNGLLYSSDGTAAGTVLLQSLGGYYSILETPDASFAAVYPFDNGLYTANVGYTDGTSYIATDKPGYSTYSQTPAAGDGAVYFPSSDGAYRMTAGGQLTLMDTAQAFNLGVVGSDAYFSTYRSVGRLRVGYSQYITATLPGNDYARPNGFMSVGSGFTFHFLGKLYFAPQDIPALPSMYGPAFNDLNRDGVKGAGEVHDTPYTIYFDLNLDGTLNTNEPSYPLNYDRPDYQFPALEPGTYVVRAVPQVTTIGDFYRSRVAWPDDSITVSLESNQRLQIPVPYFRIASRTGVVRYDTNLNDQPDSAEPGLPGRVVYADLNSDGVRDAAEPFRTTNANGFYYFRDLPVGQYPLRVELASGWYGTYPLLGTYNLSVSLNVASYSDTASFAITDQVPRGYLVGSVFEDLDGDGTLDAGEPSIQPTRVWLDLDQDGAYDTGEPTTTASSFSLGTFVTGPVQLAFDYYRWTATTPTLITLAPGARISQSLGLAVAPLEPAGIGGVTFIDSDADGQLDPGEARQSRATIWLDEDNDMLIDPDEPSTRSDASGRFAINGAPAGDHRLRWILPSASYTPTVLDAEYNGIPVTVDPGSSQPALADAMLGSRPVTPAERGSARGAIYIDANRNGVRDPSEVDAPTSLMPTFYADIDGNGAFNQSPDAAGTLTFPISLAANRYALGVMMTFPSGTGWVYSSKRSVPITVLPGQTLPAVQFGVAWPATQVSSATHAIDRGAGVIEIGFSLPVYGTGLSAIQMLDSTGQPVSFTRTTISTNRYRLTPAAALPDGSYSIRIPGVAIAGTDLPAPPDYAFPFKVLTGDLNLDGTVDFTDLLTLSQNFGLSGRTYSQGNLSRDVGGVVDFDDLLILSQHYGQSGISGVPNVTSRNRTSPGRPAALLA